MRVKKASTTTNPKKGITVNINRDITRLSMTLMAHKLQRQAKQAEPLTPKDMAELAGMIEQWSIALDFEDALDDVRAALTPKDHGGATHVG